MVASLFGTGDSGSLFVSGVLAEETFTPAPGTTVYTLTSFSYAVGTNSLFVFLNGEKLVVDVHYSETSTDSFTLFTPSLPGALIEVVGFPFSTVTIIDNTVYHQFPFYAANGTPSNIPLNSSGELPFFKTDGTPSNIPII